MISYNPNIYIGALPGTEVVKAINYAKSKLPDEACGAIINNKFVPFKNKSPKPSESFSIDDPIWFNAYINDEINCIVHSHYNSNKASYQDQVQQRELRLPSLILNFKDKLTDCILFGDGNAPLIGRPFFWGAFDCISLVRDYYMRKFKFNIEYPPHEFNFWRKHKHYFEMYLEDTKEFREVDTIKDNDILLYKIGSSVINHIAVVHNHKVLHHMYNNISNAYDLGFNRKYLVKIMRKNT